MSSEFRAPLFGPASSSSSSLPRSASQHSLMGNLPPDSIDLGDIFDGKKFPWIFSPFSCSCDVIFLVLF